MADEADTTLYRVVVNDNEQYSISPEHRHLPDGWRGIGEAATKADCLAEIERIWVDMTPASLRRHLAEH